MQKLVSTNHTLVKRWAFMESDPGLGTIASNPLHRLLQMRRVLLQQCNKSVQVGVVTREQCDSGPQILRLDNRKRTSHSQVLLSCTGPSDNMDSSRNFTVFLLIKLNSTNPPLTPFPGVIQMHLFSLWHFDSRKR